LSTFAAGIGQLIPVYSQNGDTSKRRQVKRATPKQRQKWL